MRAKALLCIIGLGLLGSGCSVVSTATRVVSARVKETIDDCLERRRNEEWAEAAWQEVCLAYGGGAFSEDHAQGFKAGFTEHLYRGTIQPPPLPPASYRCVRYQTPEGYRAIEAWFAGFRHGVSVAQAQGYRDCVTGPSALRAASPPVPLPRPRPLPPPPLPVAASEEAGPKTLLIRVEYGLPEWNIAWPW